MEFFEVLDRRRSIRKFIKKEIEEEKIMKILEAINSAPSAGDLQAYEVFLVRDDKIKKNLSIASYGQRFVEEAPIVLVFFANPSRSERKYGIRGKKFYCILDAAIAASYSQLAATSLNLGSVWVGAFDDEMVKEILNVKDLVPVAIIPIGYPAEKPQKTPRRSIKDLVKFL